MTKKLNSFTGNDLVYALLNGIKWHTCTEPLPVESEYIVFFRSFPWETEIEILLSDDKSVFRYLHDGFSWFRQRDYERLFHVQKIFFENSTI